VSGLILALYLISRGLEGTDAHIVHTQHDEIIVEARDTIPDQVRAIVKESMGGRWSGLSTISFYGVIQEHNHPSLRQLERDTC
jgi:hypothetical protein